MSTEKRTAQPVSEPEPEPKSHPKTAVRHHMVPPMTNKEVTKFTAELCSFMCNQQSFATKTKEALRIIGAIHDTIRIHIVDGTRNGEPTQAAVIRFRHTSDGTREHMYVVIRGSGVAMREKWLVENNSEPTNMVQTRGMPIAYVCGAEDIRVHKGVLRGYRSIQNTVRSAIRKCAPMTRVVITGYGFGGAIANVAALDLANRNRFDPYHADIAMCLLTFGSPLWFANKTFHVSLRRLVPKHTAYSRAWDPVPRMKSTSKEYSLPQIATTWIHDRNNTSTQTPERETYETHSVAPPARVSCGFWPLCCGCGPRDNLDDHCIDKIMCHLL